MRANVPNIKSLMTRAVLLWVLIAAPLYGQNYTNLWQQYLKSDYAAISRQAETIRSSQSTTALALFFRGLTEPNGEKAVAFYEQSLDKAKDGRLRFQAAKKIYEYYYARGYYLTADDYKKRMGLDKEIVQTNSPEKSFETPPIRFVVQVGAFSSRKNAEKMINRFTGLEATIMIKKKEIGDQQLHLVWIGPFTEKGSAENLQEQIAAKYRIKSTIKPMD
jgi:hypothetical protein